MNNMEKTDVKDIKEGKDVLLQGWVYDTRQLGKVRFMLFRDITGMVQVVAHEDKADKKTFKMMTDITRESSVIIQGKAKADKKAANKEALFLLNNS